MLYFRGFGFSIRKIFPLMGLYLHKSSFFCFHIKLLFFYRIFMLFHQIDKACINLFLIEILLLVVDFLVRLSRRGLVWLLAQSGRVLLWFYCWWNPSVPLHCFNKFLIFFIAYVWTGVFAPWVSLATTSRWNLHSASFWLLSTI